MMTHQTQQHLDKSFENAVSGSFSNTGGSSHHYIPPYSTGLSDQWENVVIPENFPEYYPSSSSSFNLNDYRYNNHMMNTHHHMSYLIKNLSPNTNYEARVQARNDHGWNKLSNVFHFSTRSEGKFRYYSLSFCCLNLAWEAAHSQRSLAKTTNNNNNYLPNYLDMELEASHTPTVLRSAGLLDKGWLSSASAMTTSKVINISSALLCILLASFLQHPSN
jgi:hypothetical protein